MSTWASWSLIAIYSTISPVANGWFPAMSEISCDTQHFLSHAKLTRSLITRRGFPFFTNAAREAQVSFFCGYSSGWWMFQHLHVPLKNTWHPNHQDEQRFGRCLPFNGFTWRPGFAITLPKPWCLGSIFRNWFTSIDMPVYGRFLWRIPLWSGVCAPSVLPEPLLPTIGEMSWSRDGALTQPSWTVLSFNRLQS